MKAVEFEDLVFAAKSGNPTAQLQLAKKYLFDSLLKLDKERALYWALQALKDSETYVKALLFLMRNLSSEYPEAFNKAKKIKDQPEICFLIGLAYRKGQIFQQNYNKAMKWYKRAFNLGCSKAAVNIGYLYEAGLGTKKDTEQAKMWYFRVLEEKNNAAFNLGTIISKEDPKTARELFIHAWAVNEDHDAKLHLLRTGYHFFTTS